VQTSTPIARSDGKFHLVGKVAGVEACQLISDKDEIIVGSAIDCDLVVADPLVPRRAFRLRREREHVDPEEPCDTYWILETFPRARTYVNGDIVRRGHVEFGDTISLGCHQLQFTAAADHEARDHRANTRIDDLCERLIRAGNVPSGFWESCPSWFNRRRMRKAVIATASAVTVVLLLWALAPRQRKFEQVQLPMEVVMLTDRSSVPDPNAVRSLDQVQRKSIPQPEEQIARSDIIENHVQPVKDLDLQPVEAAAAVPAAKPPAPRLEPVAATATPGLPALQVPRNENGQPKIESRVAKLEASATVRRLSVKEASDPVFRRELGDVEIKLASSSATATPINQWTVPVTRTVAKPSPAKLESNRAEQLAALERYKPSPLRFEKYRGAQIPVARLPGNLTELEVKQSAATPKPTEGFVLDGEVSEAEVAISWKSGRFRLHGPGTPPYGEPPTYCYVGKTEKSGLHFLYVSFVCTDPNVDQLVLNHGNGTPTLCQDDGIEIYLDTDCNRRDYYQMIVNARGNWWTSVVQNHDSGSNYTFGPAWDAQQELKTVVNKQAGRWTCEVLIPFDRVGGVPAKGSRWAVNFCRNFRGQREGYDHHLQNWFLVWDGSRNYHNPELFGIFEW